MQNKLLNKLLIFAAKLKGKNGANTEIIHIVFVGVNVIAVGVFSCQI